MAAAILPFSSSLSGTFVFDDIPAIVENPHIRALSPLSRALDAPAETTASGRPVVSLSLALNYALAAPEVRDALKPPVARDGGDYRARFLENVRGYHLFNLAVHLVSALALFGILKRTLDRDGTAGRPSSALAAATISVLWVAHPLQVSAVTYVVQRAESLMGMFLLLTLYCAIRARGRRHAAWNAAAVVACALGMGSKETMVGAPLIVMAWDWIFARSHADARGDAVWRRRWPLYAGLAATWLILAWNVWSEQRPGAAGFGFDAWPWWRYLLTQAGVILHYLRLAVVPAPLVFDYGWPPASFASSLPGVLAIGGAFALTVWGLIKRHPAAFAGVVFFVVLAPSSSVLPIVTEVAAEHRMYIPLAAVLTLIVCGAAVMGARAGIPRAAGIAIAAIAAVGLGSLTYQRNLDYASEEGVWADTVRKRPSNPRAHLNYAVALLAEGRSSQAEPHLQAALSLAPDDADVHLALGANLCATGRCADGLPHLQRAAHLNPKDPNAVRNLAEAHAAAGRFREAGPYFRRAVELAPDHVFLLNQASWFLATAPFDDVRDGAAALTMAERAVTLTGRRDAVSLDSLAVALAELGRFGEAIRAVEEAAAVAAPRGDRAFEAELDRHRAMLLAGSKIRMPPAPAPDRR